MVVGGGEPRKEKSVFEYENQLITKGATRTSESINKNLKKMNDNTCN